MTFQKQTRPPPPTSNFRRCNNSNSEGSISGREHSCRKSRNCNIVIDSFSLSLSFSPPRYEAREVEKRWKEKIKIKKKRKKKQKKNGKREKRKPRYLDVARENALSYTILQPCNVAFTFQSCSINSQRERDPCSTREPAIFARTTEERRSKHISP